MIFSEKTVWKETVAQKTNEGHYDFTKLNVRVFGLGKIIKQWRQNAELTQNKIVNELSLNSRNQLMTYERNEVGIPLTKLISWSSLCGKHPDFCLMLPSIRFSRNRKEITLPLKYSQIESIVHFLKPENARVVKVSLNASNKDLQKIRKVFSVKINFLKSFRTINSKALVAFLNTFYIYKKECKLKFPLTTIVPQLIKQKVDLRKAIILPLLQSDGSRHDHEFWLNGKCVSLHNIFADAVYYSYGLLPSGYFYDSNGEGCYKTSFISKTATTELLNLGGSFKSEPAKRQSVEEFLTETRPHMKYLENSCLLEKQTAFRSYASAEGYIGHTGKNPKLQIACANPSLFYYVKQLTEDIGLNLRQNKAKNTWSGLGSLTTGKLQDIVRFKELGGFFSGMKISGATKYLEGAEKNAVLDIVIRYNQIIIRNKKERPSKQVLGFLKNSTSFET